MKKILARLALDYDALQLQTTETVSRIKLDANPHVEEMNAVHAEASKVAQWHERRGLDWVIKNVQAGQAFDWREAQEEIKATPAIENKTFASFLLDTPITGLFAAKPQSSVTGWITGSTKEKLAIFNDNLKSAGIVIKANAALRVEEYKAEVARAEKAFTENLFSAHQFYTQVLAATSQRDRAAFLVAIHSPEAKTLSGSAKLKLLDAQVMRGQTSLDVLLNAPFSSPKEEAEFMESVLRQLDDDTVGLRFLSQSIERAQDPAQKERFRAYLSAFAGTAIPVNQNTVINANNFSGVDYAGGKLTLRDAQGKSLLEWGMPAAEAKPILDAFAARSNMLRLHENFYVNVNSYAAIQIEPGKIDFYGADGRIARTWPLSEESPQSVMDEVAKRRNFLKFDNKTFVNANHCAAVALENSNLNIYNAQGKIIGSRTGMSDGDANDLLSAFAGHSGLVAVNPTHLINVNSWAGLRHTNGTLQMSDSKGWEKLSWIGVTSASAEKIFARPGMIKASNTLAINLNHWHAVAYQSDKYLAFYNAKGGSAHGREMPPEEAQAILDAVAKRPEMIRVSGDVIVNSNRSSYTDFHEHQIHMHNLKGDKSLHWPVRKADVTRVFNQFEGRPGQIRLADQLVVNAGSWGLIGYDEGSLKLHDINGHKQKSCYADAEKIRTARQMHRAIGQANALREKFASHPRALKAALDKRTSDDAAYNSDDSLMPLVATAFLSAVTSPVHAGEHLGEDSGVTGGINDDFTADLTAQDAIDVALAEVAMVAQEVSAGSAGDVGDAGGGGGADGAGGCGGGEIRSDIYADPMFANLIDGHFGRGRFRDRDFEMR